MEIKYDEQYEQNKINIESIDGVTRSRDRDDLNEAINERLDRIETAKANGQFISEEDWKFAIKHGGGPYQRTGGGDFRRIDVMSSKEDNHFKTRNYIENEKSMAIDRQKQIDNMQQVFLDNLESRVLAGDTNPDTITQATQAIEQLNQLNQVNPQVDTNVKQPHIRSKEEISTNQESIEILRSKLEEQNNNYEKNKKTFTEERDKQRQLDASVRTQQITAMQQTNQNAQEMQQMVSETTRDNSIGGMSR